MLPKSDRLVNQLCGLERRTARSGKDSIDHGPGGHDDLANAVAGAADLVASRKQPMVISARCWLAPAMPMRARAGQNVCFLPMTTKGDTR